MPEDVQPWFLIDRAIASWSADPNLHILGSLTAKRLSIVSFLVRHGEDFLHHNFVVALLNDLFGIQARGGCSCAGPYGHRLLGIDIERSSRFRQAITSGCEGVKPGWVRVNFNYFISEATFSYILNAVRLVAERGWMLLPDYTFCSETGLWRHRDPRPDASLSLHDVHLDASGRMEYRSRRLSEPESALPGYLEAARRIFAEAAERQPGPDAQRLLSPDLEALRWFPLS